MNPVTEPTQIPGPDFTAITQRQQAAWSLKDDILHGQVLVALWTCVIAGFMEAPVDPANEPPRRAATVAAAPSESPYPAPQVDPLASPQEPAPTF